MCFAMEEKQKKSKNALAVIFLLSYRKNGMDFCQGVSSVMHLIQVVWILIQHSSHPLIALQISIMQYTSSYHPLVSSCKRTLNHSSPFLPIPHPGKDMGHRITKKCSVDCPETNVNFGVAAYSTKCCSTSLCNFSGANSIKISYAVMLLGVVASLICVIKAGL